MILRSLRRGPRSSAVVALAALSIAGLVVAACGNASVTSVAGPISSADASPVAVASAPPASADPGSAVPAASPTDSPEPSIDRHAVPTLEALLPTTVGGIDLERLSIRGPDFYKTGSDVNRSQLDELLKNLGKTVDDLNVADAGDPTGKAVFEIGIFQVAGAKPDQLLSEWVAFDQAAKPGRITAAPVTVDGRALTKIVDSSIDVGGTAHAFVVGDTIYLVKADDPNLLSAALAALPKP